MKEIALIGFVQTIFFSLLVVTKRQKETKDYLLVVFLLFVGAELIYRYLLFVISESANRWIVLFDISYWALFGPVTLLYVLYTTNQVSKFNLKQAVHFIPLVISFYSVKDFLWGDIVYSSFIEYFNTSAGLTKATLYFWEFCSPVYIVISLIILLRHKRIVKNYFSDIAGKDIKWLIVLLSGFTVYMCISYSIWIARDIFSFNIEVRMLDILPAVLTIYVFFIGFYGFRQTGILFDAGDKSNDNYRTHNRKYVKSGLSEGERSTLIARLKEIMESSKPYLESDLTINNLAEMLNTNFHKLSQVINESFDKNFYDFINSYRIIEAKRLLKSPDSEKFKIIAIAYDSGFNSKSSFYNAFRKNTGITPGEYLKKVKSLPPDVMYN
jgi:AraC-like DNA-binding protein